MPDESLPVRRKIGLERRYDGRQYAADALTRRRSRGFRHRQKKPKIGILERSAAENSPQRTRRTQRSSTDYIVVVRRLWRVCIIAERMSQTAHSGVATGYAGDTPAATTSVRPYFLSKSDRNAW